MIFFGGLKELQNDITYSSIGFWVNGALNTTKKYKNLLSDNSDEKPD